MTTILPPGNARPGETRRLPSPSPRPSVPMPLITTAAPPGMTMVAELGQIANWLKRTYMDNYQAPADDPIHAHVEAVRAHEQITMYLVTALQSRSQSETDTLGALSSARAELLDEVSRVRAEAQKDAARERESLRLEVSDLLQKLKLLDTSVEGSTAAVDQLKPLIGGLPTLQEALQADVNARARERWGQGITVILGTIGGVIIGAAVASYLFYHAFLAHAVQP